MTFLELLTEYGKPSNHKAGEYLFRQGETCRSFYLVREGLLKAYYVSDEGKENIKSFLLSGDTIGSLKGFFGAKECSFNLVCREDSSLISIDFDLMRGKSRDDLGLANEIIDFLLKFAMKKETREFELLCLPAEERYRRLLERAPDLFDRITQNEIALYLGVTPVGLSRIKKRVTQQVG